MGLAEYRGLLFGTNGVLATLGRVSQFVAKCSCARYREHGCDDRRSRVVSARVSFISFGSTAS